MHRLVYISDRDRSFAGDMEQFAFDAKLFHDEYHITGALWFSDTEFVHLMEGEAGELETVYNRITASPSHRNVQLVYIRKCKERFFADWSMAYFGDNSYCGHIARQFGNCRYFEPRDIPADRLLNLLYFLEENRQQNAAMAIC